MARYSIKSVSLSPPHFWLLSNKGTHARICWIPSRCGIEGNEKVDPWSRHRLLGKCPLYRFETNGQLLHSEIRSIQVGCGCAWHGSLSRDTNIGAPEEIPAPYQSWRRCDHQTSNWPYKGHQIQYRVPRTTDCLSPLWSNTNNWAYAPRMWSVRGISWWILHSWLIELIPETYIVEFLREAGFFYLIWCNLLISTSSETWTIWSDLSNLFREWKQFWDTFTCVGRLICPEGRVSSLHKPNPTNLNKRKKKHACMFPDNFASSHDF